MRYQITTKNGFFLLSKTDMVIINNVFTVSWMLKVTRGPGDATSIRISGKSSTSPILELKTHSH